MPPVVRLTSTSWILFRSTPLPSSVWYQDMADFAEGVSDGTAGRRLRRAIAGKEAFRRFADELYAEYPELVAP